MTKPARPKPTAGKEQSHTDGQIDEANHSVREKSPAKPTTGHHHDDDEAPGSKGQESPNAATVAAFPNALDDAICGTVKYESGFEYSRYGSDCHQHSLGPRTADKQPSRSEECEKRADDRPRHSGQQEVQSCRRRRLECV